MNIHQYKGKQILILGFGKEGFSTLKYLRKLFPNKKILVADQKRLNELPDLKKILKTDKNLEPILGSYYQEAIKHADLTIKSPGAKIIVSPKPSAKITSQTEIFLEAQRDKVIGITGTKGKTTTTSLIYKIASDAGFSVRLVGNIGNPPLDYLHEAPNVDFFVCELSSYQLQNLKFSPHIAVFLNLYKEHLDYHGSYKKYLEAKTNIIKWQKKGDFAVYNADSKIVTVAVKAGEAIKITYSISKKLRSGASLSAKWVIYDNREVLKRTRTKLKGTFNLNNILAAVCVAKILKISNKSIADSVQKFKPVKHRLEYIGTFQGINFYNDSIATIPQATIAALETLQGEVSTLITGGYNRGIPYDELSKKIVEKKIPNLILFPETGSLIWQEIKKQKKHIPKHFFVKNMKDAVRVAARVTKKGKICLLSPASSSFNLFKDYEDRGDQFASEVNKL